MLITHITHPYRLIAATTIAIALCTFTGCGCDRTAVETGASDPTAQQPLTPDELDLDPESSAAYYYGNSTVYSFRDASESPNLMSESEVLASLENRGFHDLEFNAHYDLGGALREVDEVGDEDVTHPTYNALYQTPDGDIWAIHVVEDSFTASPVGYNFNYAEIEVLVTEDELITSYDSQTDRFYEIIPNADICDVRRVQRVDAETLNGLSEEGFGDEN